ncbi:MAG TPA: right-handed parallel beta-helix repeat-containing protein [Candidatus Polarisedimenticolia bacterium]|nr:right-handed parallel beta-helix repeat-containing protein [Candidatus Polarisedimenticolia bacterium]
MVRRREGSGFRQFPLLFSALAITAAFAATSARADSLFVSPSGSDSNQCTVHAPCATIGYTLSMAPAGSRVTVLPGTYAEMVTITSPVSLIGRDATIDATGKDRGIVVQGSGAAGTRVQGFTVENATFEGIRVQETSDVVIAGNTVMDNDQGAHAETKAGECQQVGQVPGDCGEGLRLWAATYSQVLNNDVHDNVGGILVTDETGPSHDNVISGNRIRDNALDCGITLPSHNPNALSDPSAGGVYHNSIIGNDSEDNGGAGIGTFAPFPGAASYDNTIANNIVKGNGEGGINIHSHAPDQNVSGNVVTHNLVDGNGTDPDSGSPGPNGISLLTIDPQHDRITGNRFRNEEIGIWINGPFTLHGMKSNHFAQSVTTSIDYAP